MSTSILWCEYEYKELSIRWQSGPCYKFISVFLILNSLSMRKICFQVYFHIWRSCWVVQIHYLELKTKIWIKNTRRPIICILSHSPNRFWIQILYIIFTNAFCGYRYGLDDKFVFRYTYTAFLQFVIQYMNRFTNHK